MTVKNYPKTACLPPSGTFPQATESKAMSPSEARGPAKTIRRANGPLYHKLLPPGRPGAEQRHFQSE